MLTSPQKVEVLQVDDSQRLGRRVPHAKAKCLLC